MECGYYESSPAMIHHLRRTFGSPRPFKHLVSQPEPTRHYVVPTADGLSLHLRRIESRDRDSRRPPVMLLHGLAANHYSFHFPGRSIARYLADRGHDVWLPELRGHGTSLAARYDWTLDDYLTYDLPAFIDAIRTHSGHDHIHWVGHSMGGILLMAYGIVHPDAPIARGMAVASALDYKVGKTGFKPLLAMRPLLEKMGAIPYGTLTHLLAPTATLAAMKPLVSFNVWPSNIEPELVQILNGSCFHTIPVSLLSSLATTFEDTGLRLGNGFHIEKNAANLSFPIMLLAGSKDAQAGPEAIVHTARLIGDNADVVIHGPSKGDADHYGHWDLLVGRRAQQEVWPGIAGWLESP
jgi:pimeloyl-ACP methyl ester carboxylesterase